MGDRRAARAGLRSALSAEFAARPSDEELDSIIRDLGAVARARPLFIDDYHEVVKRYCPGAHVPRAIDTSHLDRLLEELLAT